ncbi:MAG: hypothetical protein EBZ00_05770 [Actinobacteria bacterium]|nr:hypothetical protein [Actinomycetota bacterium]
MGRSRVLSLNWHRALRQNPLATPWPSGRRCGSPREGTDDLCDERVRLEGVSKWAVKIDLVVVVPSALMPNDVASFHQVVHDAVNRTFADPDTIAAERPVGWVTV